MKTTLRISGENFFINDRLVYDEIPGSNPRMHGLIMNARFIQGISDDRREPSRFNRFSRTFDAETNTDDLIAALPEWYRYGMRAFTVGLQGGGNCFTIPNEEIVNTPYSRDGRSIDPKYLARLARLLNAADEMGMVVIVSLLYGGQSHQLDGSEAVVNAVRTAARFLRDGGWRNVIVEVANEYDIPSFDTLPIIQNPESLIALIELAQKESALPVGCSGVGGSLNEKIAQASDVILIHGNGQTRSQMVNLIERARAYAPGKPIVCNEDSQALSNLQVCMDYHVSWGYYNDLTKQELATDWRIVPGEDRFFAMRMAENLGILHEPIPEQEQYKLVGISQSECWQGKCWPRLAALYPEKINYVDFYLDQQWLYRSYDDPHSLYYMANWLQKELEAEKGQIRAEIRLIDGRTMIRRGKIGM